MLHSLLFAGALAVFLEQSQAQVPSSAFVNFEARQTNPLRLSPDGRWLCAVNSADARLSVFDATQTPPVLTYEIPVGIEPVSVNPLTNDEVWVVNELSDSVSIVSLSRGIVTDTINVKDEPADVVFAGAFAFVSVAGNNEVRVYSTSTHALVKTIPLNGQQPRALAVSPNGTRIYVAFAESGNRTTLIPADKAPSQPKPTNRSLPQPPKVGLIVDATDTTWRKVIKYTMPDNDVAEIDTSTLAVTRYFPRVGTSNLGLAVQPTTGDIFVTNTDARNLVHFEPNLRAHFVDNRVTRISNAGGALRISDLNPGVNYSVLPNPSAQATALGQPTAIVFAPQGTFAYVAAFGSDRIAKMNADGTVASRIDLAGAAVNPRNKRGPRGLALNAGSGKLYSLNRISNTISVVDTAANAVVSEVPVGGFDPTPVVIKNGRGFLYDARLSGNGTVSCASCHLDGTNDRLAWDLGDPNGQMQNVVGPASLTGATTTFPMHPMKGPMTTQTLKGLKNLAPLHWRGDRAGFTSFSPAFASLLGGSQLTPADMDAFAQFVETMNLPPNPNQQLDRTLPPTHAGGNPAAGMNTFRTEPYTTTISCNMCHKVDPGPGTDKTFTSGPVMQQPQTMKVPQLRTLYQKKFFNTASGAVSLDGFGLTHDGTDPGLFAFISRPVFTNFTNDTVRKTNISAFLLCLDTGTAPAVGFTRTVTATNVADPAVTNDWTVLQSQAAASNIDLIAKGTVDGAQRGLVYDPVNNSYLSDKTGVGPFSQAELQAKIAAGDILSITGVPLGSGVRMGIDRDLDGRLDGDPLVVAALP
ncbi:MAG TPA: beta-propeller fold lactonase family protein [Chthoniobacterales bacterium]|nr:beta-propeller fold lactonase family protein [Chthoniobacterales bacterium]